MDLIINVILDDKLSNTNIKYHLLCAFCMSETSISVSCNHSEL